MSNGFCCACTTCLRTHLSLETTRFFTRRRRSLASLEKIGGELVKKYPSLEIELPMRTTSATAGVYESLDDAADVHYSSALFVLKHYTPSEEAAAEVDTILHQYEAQTFAMGASPVLRIYDNTIAMLDWIVEAESTDGSDTLRIAPRDFDRMTTAAARVLVDDLERTIIATLENHVRAQHASGLHWWKDHGASVFLPPDRLQLFAGAGSPALDDDTHLWTSRLAVLPGMASLADREPGALDWYRRWAEIDGTWLDIRNHGCDCRIGWGNSALAGRGCRQYLPRFLAVNRRLQYFYAVTFIHNRNLSRLFMLGFSVTGRALTQTVRQHKLIQTNLYYLESLMFDTENGLQGSAYRIYRAYYGQWRFQKLLAGSQRKAEMAADALRRRLSEKRFALQKSLRSLLVALSTIEILGVFVDLVALAHNNEAEGGSQWGVLKLIRTENADTVITSVLALLILLVILVLFAGIRANKE